MFWVTGLGDRLKEARTAKGFTLDDLQSITKIQKRYLASIEEEDYSNMPGSFYVRAFIKQYAEAVGLDSDEMLLLYQESPKAISPEEEEQQQLVSPSLSRRSGAKRSSELTQVMPKIIVALFIIVIISAVSYLWSKNPANKVGTGVDQEEPITVQDQQELDEGTSVIIDDEEKGQEKAEVEDEPDTEVQETEQVLTNSTVNGEDATYTLENAEGFLLKIKTADDSWIGVQDSSRVERMPKPRGAYTMAAGESVDLDVSDTESVRIRVGRTASTEIYVNDELLEYESDRTTQNIIIEYKKEQ